MSFSPEAVITVCINQLIAAKEEAAKPDKQLQVEAEQRLKNVKSEVTLLKKVKVRAQQQSCSRVLLGSKRGFTRVHQVSLSSSAECITLPVSDDSDDFMLTRHSHIGSIQMGSFSHRSAVETSAV